MQTRINGVPVQIDYLDNGEDGPGWYYACCFPGCFPDSDWYGPYDTEQDALEAAQETYGE